MSAAASCKTAAHGVARRRPAECSAAGGGLAGVAVALTSGNRVTAVVALVGFLPAVVSYVVERGGVLGLGRDLLHGTAVDGPQTDAGSPD